MREKQTCPAILRCLGDSLPLPELRLETLMCSCRADSKDSGLWGRMLWPRAPESCAFQLLWTLVAWHIHVIALKPTADATVLAAAPPISGWVGWVRGTGHLSGSVSAPLCNVGSRNFSYESRIAGFCTTKPSAVIKLWDCRCYNRVKG